MQPEQKNPPQMPPSIAAPRPQPMSPSAPAPEPYKTQPAGNQLIRKIFTDTLMHWLFRIGFASIFLVNSVYAAIEPQSFTQLLYSNPIASAIGYEDTMVKFAMVNDLLLGVAILAGWRKKFVYAWAGVWLLAVTGIKAMNLII